MAHLKHKGIEFEGPVPFDNWSARSIYFDDLDANRVELCALPPACGASTEPPVRGA